MYIAIAPDSLDYGQGETLEDAFNELNRNCSYVPEIQDVEFYKAEKVKVKYQLVIENEVDTSIDKES